MHPVDEYARLKAEIRVLQDRADQLRDGFLEPDAKLRSNQTEVVLKTQTRRLFLKERLPSDILQNPVYWEDRQSSVVTLRSLQPAAEEEDILLLEPF